MSIQISYAVFPNRKSGLGGDALSSSSLPPLFYFTIIPPSLSIASVPNTLPVTYESRDPFITVNFAPCFTFHRPFCGRKVGRVRIEKVG